jgi:hypothetical protein
VFTLTFAYFVRGDQPVENSGAPFVLAAALLFAAAVWAFIATRHETKQSSLS